MPEEKNKKEQSNGKAKETKSKNKPNKDIKPPKFFVLSEGVVGKTKLEDLSDKVNEQTEKYFKKGK